MSSMSQTLTSTAEDLFNYLKVLNKQAEEPQPVDIFVPPSESIRSVSGRYKLEVHDDAGKVYDTGDWKPNLILNCGMDKVAEMPGAQVFQWAVAGTDATPTKESFEETGLKVQLLESTKCEEYDWNRCDPWDPPVSLLARATDGTRRVADAAPLGSCLQKSFGETSDNGSLLYFRDLDLQYNVISSCPVYDVEPVLPEVKLLGTCTTSLCSGLLRADVADDHWNIASGQGYVGLLSTDTGAPWNQGGLILERQSFDLPTGDCTGAQDTLLYYPNSHMLSGGQYVNPAVGIKIDPPNVVPPTYRVRSNGTNLTTIPATQDVLQSGKGLPTESCSRIPINFALPKNNCSRGDWRDSPYFTAHANGQSLGNKLRNTYGDGLGCAGNMHSKSLKNNQDPTDYFIIDKNHDSCGLHGDTRNSANAGQAHQTAWSYPRNASVGDGEWGNLLKLIQSDLSLRPLVNPAKMSGDALALWRQLNVSNVQSLQQLLSHAAIWYYFRPKPTGSAFETGAWDNRAGYYMMYRSHGYPFWLYTRNFPSNLRDKQSKSGGDHFVDAMWAHPNVSRRVTTSDIYHSHSIVNANADPPLNSNGYYVRNVLNGVTEANFNPTKFLPYWLHNNLTSFDLSNNAGGAQYLAAFNGTWNNLYDALLNCPYGGGCNTGSYHMWGNNGAWGTNTSFEHGNKFSGLPLGALQGLPTYKYEFTGNEIYLGETIESMELPSPAHVAMYVGDTTTSRSGNANPFVASPAYHFSPNLGRLTNTTNPFPNFQWADCEIVDGQLKSITFDWNALYDTIVAQAGEVQDALNDNNLITTIGFRRLNEGGGGIVFKPGGVAAKGYVQVDKTTRQSTGIEIISGGSGYCPGEIVQAVPLLEQPRQATGRALMNDTGGVSAIQIIDPGAGYSTTEPVNICFPPIPIPQPVSYDLRVRPVDTYQSINNGHFHESAVLPTIGYDTDIFKTQQTYLGNQYKTHGWYVTGSHPETNATYCGTDFLSAANQVAMTRTFDFYMELQPVTYTEIGFKESPASRELFSRIVLENPIKLCPGQFLRVAYQLIINWEPGDVPRYKVVPSNEYWYNVYDATDDAYYLSGFECIQGNGMCVVGDDGIAIPYDITGVANEPYAPGSTNLGPQYGRVNRWKNGDTRLSWPTKEYNTDSENPWILGGDQVNPPDWAQKFWDSPTVNYMPRDFKSYVEWPAVEVDVPDVSNRDPLIQWKTISIPSGPELPLERDAFDHWFTKALPTENNTLTWTNFVPNFVNGRGRWDYLVTKGYLADIYPQALTSSTVYHNDIRSPGWIDAYYLGERLYQGGPGAYSWPGVFPGPVVEYTGTAGSLHDPMAIKGRTLSRNVSHLRNPWAQYDIRFLEPNNTGGSGGPVTITYTYCQGGTLTFNSPDFCWKNMPPLNTNTVEEGRFGLAQRQAYYDYGSVKSDAQFPVDNDAGGGITKLDSWAPWSHTPLITSTELAYLTGDDRDILVPDTVGNWSLVEAIPVAGSSAFISTSDESFAPIGFYTNRSHTLSGCWTSPNSPKPYHDFTGNLSFETPTFVDEYIPSSCKTIKRATFETNFANLTGVKCIGLGPTSTTLKPVDMTDSARFNTYLFKFGDVDTAAGYKGLDKLATYKLNVSFQNVWYRNLKV